MKRFANSLRCVMHRIWLEKLKTVMAERGLKAKPLSLAAGLNETYVWDLLNRGVDPTIGKLGALADAMGLPLSYFVNEQGRAGYPEIPVVGYVAGGDEWQPFDDGEALTVVDTASLDLRQTDGIAIRVRGHSMSPVFRDGDDLICSRQRGADMVRALNQDCVVKTADNLYLVKHVLKGPSRATYRLRSYNPAYADIESVVLEWAAPIIWIKRKLNEIAVGGGFRGPSNVRGDFLLESLVKNAS